MELDQVGLVAQDLSDALAEVERRLFLGQSVAPLEAGEVEQVLHHLAQSLCVAVDPDHQIMCFLGC